MHPYIYHIHHRQYMPHACTVIKQCPPAIVYETGTCLRGHLSAHQTWTYSGAVFQGETLPIYETACRYCVLWFWGVLLCTVLGSVDVEISTAMVTCLLPLQQLIGFAHSRLTLSHRPGPSGTLPPTALELLLFSLFLSLFHTLRRKVGQGRCRDPRPNSVIRSQFLIRVVRFTFLLASTFWIMFG